MRFLIGLLLFGLSFWSAHAGAADVAQERSEVKATSEETLAQLYQLQPAAKKSIAGSAGYAVFSNFGMKLGIAGGGSGSGMAVNNKTKAVTYMKMVEVQAGLGIGVKRFRLVWVFQSQQALQKFIDSGWEFGAQTTAAAQASGQGAALAGAVSVAPGVWLYQLTGDGLALELTAKGTKYYKDDKLN